jgi:hypothetical protein
LVTAFFRSCRAVSNRLGSDVVDSVSNLKFGLAKQFAIGLGGEKPCQSHEVLIRRLLRDLENALRFGFLVGRQWLGGDGYSNLLDEGPNFRLPSSSPKGAQFSTSFTAAYPPANGPADFR